MYLTAPENIRYPVTYFEEGCNQVNRDLGLEMMSNAVQALLLGRSSRRVDQALGLVKRMPPTCIQRDYALSAIALKQIGDVERALATANMMTHYQYFIETILQICGDRPADELTAMVVDRFPDVSPSEIQMMLAPVPY
ncbi:MAG: hypothetical protein S4CHLAM2_16510 [Chlamydiales bacterium]|nr:hypothetical protein [Chlamydiales bacterium]